MTDRKLPVGIQSFEDLRRNGYLYVDKTEYIWQLVQSGKVYFLSRPRRFGKSLLISTIEAYFRGQKELFEGLKMEELESGRGEDAWQEYPVIRFSLSGGEYNEENGLRERLLNTIHKCAAEYGLDGDEKITEGSVSEQFINLIERLRVVTGRQVVVLVDEYDKPLLETMIVNEGQEEKNRRLYKSFFSVLKDEDQYLKFVFFTGVTRFSKVSVFSDLNQLEDISLNNDFSGICGISEEELRRCFRPEIQRMAVSEKMTEAECLDKLKQMYDGYHFSAASAGMYNPFSLLNALKQRDFGSYWFATGTPTFLINKLKKSAFTAEQFADGVKATELSLMDFQEQNPDPVPLLFQTGYLTISGFDRRFRLYELRFPNYEVKYAFMNSLVDTIIPGGENRQGFFVMNFVLDLEGGDIHLFMDRLTAVFASIPYTETPVLSYENEWRNEIYLLLAMLGMNVRCEVHTSHGRADCIVETDRYVYIFEFKLDRTAEEALRQIEDKGYALPYKADSREVIKVGANFSSLKRNIEDWKAVRS